MTSSSSGPVLWEIDARGVATVTLNRPEVNNAYDGAMIDGIAATLDALGSDRGVRVVVIRGAGKHFQAGADLAWVNGLHRASGEENRRASRATLGVVRRLNAYPAPTVALVQGACFGGGTGIVAACDVVVAAENALFSIAEVRWGLTAAPIVPFLADAIGVRELRRYGLTGERFGAAEACRIGLAHLVVPLPDLELEGARLVELVLQNGPEAVAETKAWILRSAWGELDDAAVGALVEAHASRRQSAEAGEGLAAFAEKRAPCWRP
jgi:methylglutaconyl-CoA hydratase